jgi:hypothetical protein
VHLQSTNISNLDAARCRVHVKQIFASQSSLVKIDAFPPPCLLYVPLQVEAAASMAAAAVVEDEVLLAADSVHT